MQKLRQWLYRHRLHALGLLLILSTPFVSWYSYLGLSWIGDALEWGFLATLFLGAMGIVLGGAVGTYGLSLLVGRHNLIAGDAEPRFTRAQERTP